MAITPRNLSKASALLLSWVKKDSPVEHGVHICCKNIVLFKIRLVDCTRSLEYAKSISMYKAYSGLCISCVVVLGKVDDVFDAMEPLLPEPSTRSLVDDNFGLVDMYYTLTSPPFIPPSWFVLAYFAKRFDNCIMRMFS
mgnify:CR=1 FL=1